MRLVNLINTFIADVNVLNIKLYNIHFNIKGDEFLVVHKKTEELYDEIQMQFDIVAETLKTLNVFPVSSLSEFLSLTNLKELKSQDYKKEDFVKIIITDFDYMKEFSNEIANEAVKMGIKTIEDTFRELIRYYSKEIWLISSMI